MTVARAGLQPLHSVADVADALGTTERYVKDKARSREWPHVRVARGEIKFTADDYARVLELMRVDVEPSAPARLALAPRSGRRRST